MGARDKAAMLMVGIGLCLAGLGGCGASLSNGTVVVRVGDLAITKATVEHWTRVIERGGAFSGFRGAPPRGPAMQRAVTALITSNWLVGEATRLGVASPAADIQQAVVEREQSPEFRKRLRATGESVADVELETRAELAGEAIREKLARRAAQVTPRELTDFYHQNGRQFVTLEVRVTDLIENLSSSAAATALVKRIGTGRAFAAKAIHEHVLRTPGFLRTAEKVKLVNAIFQARPGVGSQPMKVNGLWAVFVLRSVIPPAVKPLTLVRSEVLQALNVARQHEIAARFDSEYQARWRSRTSCRSGYVAAGCPQFSGPLDAYEDPFSRRAHPLLSEAALPE